MTSVVRIDQRNDPIWRARVDLAAVHRLAHRNGFDDGIWNHFTVMVPGTTDQFLVKPHGLLMSEVTASNLIVANFDGKVVEGNGEIETTAYCIHAQIHKLHPNANAVLHCHPYYASWLCMTEPGRLLPIHQDFLRFLPMVAYDDHFNGSGSTLEEGARIAHAAEGMPILVSANHGLTSMNASVAEAWYELFYFERACKAQHSVMMTNEKPRMVRPEIITLTQRNSASRSNTPAFQTLEAMKRDLDREEPDYKS